MKSVLTILAFVTLAFCASAQTATDSTLQHKFVLSTKNAAAENGKFKHVDVALDFNKEYNSYTLKINSEKSFKNYLEIKDQDDNVIYFKEVNIAAGSNTIALDTEDGAQSLFKVSFQDMKDDNSPLYVLRLNTEIAISKK